MSQLQKYYSLSFLQMVDFTLRTKVIQIHKKNIMLCAYVFFFYVTCMPKRENKLCDDILLNK